MVPAPLAPVTPAAPAVPVLKPVVAPRPAAKRPVRRLFYKVASRRALRVAAALNPPETPVLRVRLYRLNGRHEGQLVGSVVVRTGNASDVRTTLRVPGGLAPGRYRLTARAGRVADDLRLLSTLDISVRP